MKKINWIILWSEERGSQYGVGTFIKELSRGLAKKEEIAVFILKIGVGEYDTIEQRQEEGITILQVPLTEQVQGTDTRKNQERFARSVVRVSLQFILPADINVIHMNFIFQYFIAREFKQKLNALVLFTQHVFTFEKILSSDYFDTEQETYQMADRIITVTNHGKNHLTAKGVNENKVRVIYNGINPGSFDQKAPIKIKEKYGLPENEYLVLFSGRIDQIKGLDYLTSAFEMLFKPIPDCRLVIAGNGDFESMVKATSHFSSRVSFLGFIPFVDLVSLYHEATIGVIPSLEEHCSYVALEMLHNGLPVVASNLGGLKEIFVHGENALLVDIVTDKTNMYGIAPKVRQLEEYLFKLLTDEPMRTKFSQNAKKRADSIFTANIMINNYLQIVKKLN